MDAIVFLGRSLLLYLMIYIMYFYPTSYILEINKNLFKNLKSK